MRLAALILLAFMLAASAATAAARTPPGSLTVEGASGSFEIKGQGGLLGRVDRGTLMVMDLTPADRFVPRVNGDVPLRAKFSWRGKDGTFYIPGGRYRVLVRGEGISLSARGRGAAVLDGEPDAFGELGLYAVGETADCRSTPDSCLPVPDVRTPISFGAPFASD